MVLHRGDNDVVTAADMDAAIGVRDEVDCFGRTADENDVARIRRVQEACDGHARMLVGRGRLLTQRMDAAMDVGVLLDGRSCARRSMTACGFWVVAALSR